MIRWIAISFTWTLITIFYGHRNYGKKNIPKGGGLIASNHCSYLDPPIIGVAAAPDVVHFLARESLFKFSLFAWLIRKLNTHPVKQGKGNAYVFKKAIELLNSGKKIVIFPEGHRSQNGEIGPGQLGVGILVQRTGCRVIPVYLHGTYEAWNATRKFPKLCGKTACVFGSPIEFSEILAKEDKKEAQVEITNMVMDRIKSLRDWYLAGAKGNPP